MSRAAPGATGAVLAGGRGRRMGTDKARLAFGGAALLARRLAQLQPHARELLVVGRAPERLGPRAPDAAWIEDAGSPGRGPLAGIAAALAAASWDLVLVTAVDMPFLEPALVGALLARAAARPDALVVFPRGEEGPEPLLAVYRRRAARAARAALRAGERSPRRFLASIPAVALEPREVRRLDPSGRSLLNVNTPGDLARARRLAPRA